MAHRRQIVIDAEEGTRKVTTAPPSPRAGMSKPNVIEPRNMQEVFEKLEKALANNRRLGVTQRRRAK